MTVPGMIMLMGRIVSLREALAMSPSLFLGTSINNSVSISNYSCKIAGINAEAILIEI